MPKLSIAYRILSKLNLDDIKHIIEYYDLSIKKNKEQMILEIIKKTGEGLDVLISKEESPFFVHEWNERIEKLGGNRRQSYMGVLNEIKAVLDYKDNEIKQNNFKINLASTTATDVPDIKKLDIKWMEKYFQGADEISIAAGFYDEVFIRNRLLKNIQVKKIRLLFNGLGGLRLEEQRQDLLDLRKKLIKSNPNVDIRLFFSPGLFHSKLFLIKKNIKLLLLLGRPMQPMLPLI